MELWQRSAGMSTDPEGGGDVGGAVAAVDADREVAQARHHRWSVTGTDMGHVFAVPRLVRYSACSRWVCSAPVMIALAMSMTSCSGAKAVS